MNETDHEDFVVVNVLPPDAFNEQHIRTSVNISMDNVNFESTVEKIAGCNASCFAK